jgi:beta-galactosidase/beta-glucuronidase
MRLSASFKKTSLALALACLALAATAAAAYAPPNQLILFEGPGGRTALTRWTLRSDPANSGSALGWQRGGFAGRSVSVPNVVDPTHYSGHQGTLNYEGSVAWYRTTFKASRAGVYALSFQSANFLASVFVDGRKLGSHRGSYLPFEERASLSEGPHTVVVRVDWRNPGAQSRAGFHRTWFNWGGLDGEVDVRPVGASELSNPTIETTLSSADVPEARTARVKVSVQVRNNGPTGMIAPEGSLVHETQTIPLAFAPLTLAHGQSATATAITDITQPALWSPTHPNLYQLSLAAGAASSYSARIGLRQLTWHSGRIFINGEQLKLHGASIQEDARGHGDALTPGDEDAIVSELQAIGANAARAQHPLDPALLERLDAAGILVWQGIGPVEGAGNWYSSTPRLNAEAEQQARTAAIAAELHPSIFAWNLVDEVAGDGHGSAEIQYVRTLTRWLHAHDPTRMVAVDVWGDHPPRHAGSLYSEVDAVAETDYSGWYDSPRNTPVQLRTQMRTRLAAMEHTFAGKVIVISEFGAESNTLNPPGSAGSYAFQSRLLAAHIAVYSADPKLTAMFVWVLRDYPLTPNFTGGSIHRVLPRVKLIEGLNQKGLFTYGGQAKPAAGTVARLFAALANAPG